MGVIEMPTQPTTAIRVVYVDSRLSTGKDTLSPSASSVLYRVGYFDVGEKIKNLAPEILSKRDLLADAITMKEEVFIGGGFKEAKTGYKSKEPLRLLILYFKRGQTINYGGPYADLTFQAYFKDAQTNKLYWKGEYQSTVRMTPFGGTKFDDKFVSEMLDQVFLDMEKAKMLPALKSAQLIIPPDAAR